MATITFHANNSDIFPSNPSNPPDLIEHTSGSGLGFFGGGFGISVPVNAYQTSTYVTNSNGIQTVEFRFRATLPLALPVFPTSLLRSTFVLSMTREFAYKTVSYVSLTAAISPTMRAALSLRSTKYVTQTHWRELTLVPTMALCDTVEFLTSTNGYSLLPISL
jgi:hypothetical protein